MIKSIKISDVATFDISGVEINECNKVNIIYGTNGSGKTTISKFFVNQNEPCFSSCSLEWESNNLIQTLVYNKEFKEKNFSGNDISGVFSLGEATTEEIKTIEEMKINLDKIREDIIQKERTITKQEETIEKLIRDFEDLIWNVIKNKNEVDFRDAFKGSGLNSKAKFRQNLLSMFSKYNAQFSLSREDIIKKANIIFGQGVTRLDKIPLINGIVFEEIELDRIWKKKIVGKQDVNISGLIKKLNNSDWVNQGRDFLMQDTCPFCQQKTISDDFRAQLNEFFDSEYESSKDKVSAYQKKYITYIKSIIDEVGKLIDTQKNQPNSKLDIREVTNVFELLKTSFRENELLINNKVKEPSHTIDINSSSTLILKLNELLLDANEKIKVNNELYENFENEKTELIRNIWQLLISENIGIIKKFLAEKSGLEQGINSIKKRKDYLNSEFRALSNKIIESTKNVTSVQPSVDAINHTLASFGFDSFKIVPSKKKNHYQIQREDGTVATETLSEGEITFITLLYFLERAKGGSSEDNITDNRILVIDDPVSSLDCNVLFIVSSLIKGIIESVKNNSGNIKQLFILTHNVYFHKEVSFINGRNREDKDIYYWILRKDSNKTSIKFYEKNNPINTSYGLLWHELRENDSMSSVNVQNIMRRIIEDYFKILGGMKDDDLLAFFSDPHEREICKSLLSWINDGSHCIPDDIYIDSYTDSMDRYLSVFENIFKYSGNGKHFEMMMKTG